MKKKIIPYICSVSFLILIWWIISCIINEPLILPDPLSVIKAAVSLAGSVLFWKSFSFTLIRICTAFIISVFTGFIIGFITSKWNFIKDFIELYISILQVTPVVALILVVTFWFKSDIVPVFVAVIMTMPVMIKSVYKGFTGIDPQLLDMASVYKLPKIKIFFRIKLPAASSCILLGLETIFRLTWKVIVAGEVLSLPKYSVGTMMEKGNVHLETDRVMALSLLLILFCFIFQKIVSLVLSCKEHKNIL